MSNRPVIVMALLFAAGCATHTPEAAPEPAPAPAASAPVAPAPTAETVERLTITLDPSEMSYEGATAKFSPDSRRQAASYTTYVLDLPSLEAALGGRPTEPVAVVIEVGPASVENQVPSDPNMPAPMGGFDYITRTGRVVAKAPAE